MKQPSTVFHYRAYILRLWQECSIMPDDPAVWRFSLPDISTLPQVQEQLGASCALMWGYKHVQLTQFQPCGRVTNQYVG